MDEARGKVDIPCGEGPDDAILLDRKLSFSSSISDLPLTPCEFDVEVKGGEIEAYIRDHPGLPGFIVTQDGGLLGVVSCRKFNEIISQDFGRAIFLTRPIRQMLNKIDADPLILGADETINDAVDKALARPSDLAYEPVVVNSDDQAALLNVETLIRAQSLILKSENAKVVGLLEDVRLSERSLRNALDELKETQNRLVHSEKMAALGQLVAGVAHEINTPIGIALTAITYLSEQTGEVGRALNDGTMKKSMLEDYLQTADNSVGMVQSNIHRAVNLIQSFKQIAVDQTSEARRNFRLKGFLDELLTSLHPEFKRSGHEVKLECGVNPAMSSYPGALGQVVTNLVKNAMVHAYDEGQNGQIRIIVDQPLEAGLRLLIKDDGKGIPADILPRIFDPFFTTKRNTGGSGLGLQIVHNLVSERLGGELTVDSIVGKGTEFSVRIPLNAPDQPE